MPIVRTCTESHAPIALLPPQPPLRDVDPLLRAPTTSTSSSSSFSIDEKTSFICFSRCASARCAASRAISAASSSSSSTSTPADGAAAPPFGDAAAAERAATRRPRCEELASTGAPTSR
eukprot:4472758-Prymnesium_polylepis.1